MPRPAAIDALKRTTGQPRLIVRRESLLHNLRLLREAAHGQKICGVVKANGYGHGALGVADTLVNYYTDDQPAPAVDALAVATLAEAESLLADLGDLEIPLFCMRPVENVYLGENRVELEGAVRRGVILSLISSSVADDVARVAERLGVRAPVQVMLDTGMTREGCAPEAFGNVVGAILSRPSLRLAAIGTHFTDAEEEDEPYSDEQLRMFHEFVDPLLEKLPQLVRESTLLHAGNSGGTFFAPDDTLDMVRPGLSLYGVDPTGRPSVERPLRPVAQWTAPLLSVQEVAHGTAVGYNRTWRAAGATRIGLLGVGYADGYPRSLSNQAVVRLSAPPSPEAADGNPLHDAFCRVVGRVSMDYLTIDLTDAPWAKTGDEATLLDSDPHSPCSIYALAEQAGTIPYEVLAGIGARITRVVV